MKSILITILLLAFSLGSSFSRAEDTSAGTLHGAETYPVIPAVEGEGELTLDSEKPAIPRAKQPLVKSSPKAENICSGEGDLPNCKKSNGPVTKKPAVGVAQKPAPQKPAAQRAAARVTPVKTANQRPPQTTTKATALKPAPQKLKPSKKKSEVIN